MQAVESLPAMVWIARPDMSCEYVSPQWLAFTGHTPEQALGEGWACGIHPEDLARWLDTAMRAFDVREPYEIEYRLRRSDGAYRWVLDRAVPRHGAGGAFLGFVGACIDIDQRKRAEHGIALSLERERKLRVATEEASRVKDGFVASLLQDLQSPLRAIASCAADLRRELPSGSEAAQALDGIEQNALRQQRIVGDLADLARLGGAPTPRRASRGAALLAGVRVLVVEDDPMARDTVLKVLQVAGAEARVAMEEREALRLLEEWRPHVVLSDVRLLDEAGYVLVRALRARRGHARLPKPLEPVTLLATVAQLAQPASA